MQTIYHSSKSFFWLLALWGLPTNRFNLRSLKYPLVHISTVSNVDEVQNWITSSLFCVAFCNNHHIAVLSFTPCLTWFVPKAAIAYCQQRSAVLVLAGARCMSAVVAPAAAATTHGREPATAPVACQQGLPAGRTARRHYVASTETTSLPPCPSWRKGPCRFEGLRAPST